jgi:hypothetical protein
MSVLDPKSGPKADVRVESDLAQVANVGCALRACRRSVATAGLVHRNTTDAYSITSSARVCKLNGISRPRALAVGLFKTNSKRVGCSTGISAGDAPFKILSI